jgi:hypothetical protein
MVFDKIWFEKNQHWLKIALNFPIPSVRERAREVLGITEFDSYLPVMKITPNSFHLGLDREYRIGQFWSREPIAKSLYYRLHGIWNLMHRFDIGFANKYCPALNLGYDSTPFYSAAGAVSPCDGLLVSNAITTIDWDTRRNYTNANSAYASIANYFTVLAVNSSNGGGNNQIMRTISNFDLTSLVGANITAGTLSIYPTNATYGTLTFTMGVCSCTPASTSNVVIGDYSAGVTITGAIEYVTRINCKTTTWNQYKDMALNAAGLSHLSTLGITSFMYRGNLDLDGYSGNYFQDYYILQCNTADDTTNKPKLTITYTIPGLNKIQMII